MADRDIAVESVKDSAYFNSCECPVCGNSMFRDSKEQTRFCSKCGQKLHIRAFTKEEVRQAAFDHQMDDFED